MPRNDLAEMNIALDRPLPQNPDAERAVLGSILLNSVALYRMTGLRADHFFKESNRLIYLAIDALHRESQPIDLLTVKMELQRAGQLEFVGGAAYVASLTDMVPDIANCERYAAICREKAALRALLLAGNVIMRAALEPDADSLEIASMALNALGRQATDQDRQARPLAEVLGEACDAQERRRTGVQDSIALTSGYPTLDGVRAFKRAFCVLGGPSEHGKSAGVVNFASGLADNGHPGVVFTLETTEEEWALRYASMKGGIHHGLMQDWRLMGEGNFARLARVRKIASEAPIFLTRKVRSVEEIYLECQRLKATEAIDYVMIDYIQIVRLSRGPRDREERFAEIAQAFLEMAIELGVMVLCTSQVNRDWTKRDSGRLIKEDLKYAAAIAETARVVMFMHRPRAVDKTNDAYPWCEVKYQVEKNNENKTVDVAAMHFDEATQQLREGDCAANDCARLRSQTIQRSLV